MEAQQARTCGNCVHLFPLRAKKDAPPEPILGNHLWKGKCECNGKTMMGDLKAGCAFWKLRGEVQYG